MLGVDSALVLFEVSATGEGSKTTEDEAVEGPLPRVRAHVDHEVALTRIGLLAALVGAHVLASGVVGCS